MQELFYMGGKAIFVWSAYGITALILVLGVALAGRRKRKLLKEIEENIGQ